MSNSVFHHENPKVTDAMVIIVGVLHKGGTRSGHEHLKEFGRKIRLDIYERQLARLGNTPAKQREVIDQALTLVVNRGLVSFQRRSKRLALTRKGICARQGEIQLRRQLATTA